MSKLKVEVFLSALNDSKDKDLSKLLEEIKDKYGDKVEITVYSEQNELFNKYHLTATPAAVIEEMIKVMGFYPSKETLVSALKESGLE